MMPALLFVAATFAGGQPAPPPPPPRPVVVTVARRLVPAPKRPVSAPKAFSLADECTKPVVTYHGCVYYMPGLGDPHQ